MQLSSHESRHILLSSDDSDHQRGIA